MVMKRHLMFLTVGILLLMPGIGFADEISLKNGDRITGEVVRMEENKLLVKTAYAGEITIKWEDVQSVKTERPIKIMLKDETLLEGTSDSGKKGKMKLDTAKLEKPAAFDLGDVKTINPVPKKPVKITARANVSLSNERGNTDSDNYYVDGEFIARTEKNRYTVSGGYKKEKSNGVTTSQSAIGYGEYNHFLNRRWYLLGNALFEHDEFKDLTLRSTLGAGAGYQLFETPILNLSVSAGLAWVDENFDVAEDNNYPAGQWFINFDQYFFKEFVQLFHKQTGYVSLENSSDWFFKTRTGLRFPFYKGLTATLQFNYDWDNQPSTAAETEEDTKFLLLLGYQFAD